MNPNSWLVTFSDLLGLLLTFFVMIIATSSLDNKKLNETIGEFNAYLGSRKMVSAPQPSGNDTERLKAELENMITKEHWNMDIKITDTPEGLKLSFYDRILFANNSSKLSPEIHEPIKKLAVMLIKSNAQLRVEGHTDNRPVHKPYPSNWELSVARASAVTEALERAGMPSNRLYVTGFADSRPIAPNDSEDNRSMNRRVEIAVVMSPENR